MIKRVVRKGLVFGVILLFVGASFIPSIIGNTTELDKKLSVKSQKQIDDQEDVIVTCYNFGLPGKPSKQIEMSQYEAEYLYEKIQVLNIAVAEDPLMESTQQLQIEIIDLADEYDLLPTGLSKNLVKEKYIHAYNSQTSRIGSLTPRTQGKASAFFCNFAIAGTGSQTPVIILPRLIPIIQLPIPRVILRWNALDGVASCGGLRSGKGFIALGQQTGTALGFWGIGFSIFLPPFMQYGFIGYALYASANAEIIELWPPNYPPEISHINPGNGEMDVSISLSELQFEISDFNGDRMSYTVTTTPDIGSGAGNLKPDGVYSVSISGLEDLTEYSWHIEVTDGEDTTTEDSSFTTEANAPIISDPFPNDGSRHTSVDLDHLSFHMKDFQGDSMDYTVETSPDIGSGSEDGVGDGTYTVPVNNLDFDTEYSWYVNVTDGTHWMYKVFHFKTRIEPGPWWDDSWSYRKYLGIMGVSPKYQMNLRVWMEDGHDNTENINIDCENHCKEDFSDIRFVTFDGVECKYWIEEIGIDDGDHYATIWMKTPSSGDEQLYLYYGNPDATDQSSGDDTFIRFDDFDDYDIDEIPKASRGWSTTYENGANWWKTKTNPDGTGLVLQGHSSSSDLNFQYLFQNNFADKGTYAVHYKLYKDNGITWKSKVYSLFKEDDVQITTFHHDNTPWIIEWHGGDTYHPFIPNLSPKNGWANVEERSFYTEASLVQDGVEGIGGCRNEPIVGVESWQIYPFRKDTHDMFIDDFFIRRFMLPEPLWESFGPEETGP